MRVYSSESLYITILSLFATDKETKTLHRNFWKRHITYPNAAAHRVKKTIKHKYYSNFIEIVDVETISPDASRCSSKFAWAILKYVL